MELRVATFNIRNSSADDGNDSWPLRREATVAAVAALDAEVVGLQEVLPDQLAYLREALPAYDVVGAGRDDGDATGEHASVLVRRDAWRIESHETRWLSLEPERPGSVGWDAHLTRIATLARLRRRESGRAVGIANTHYDHAGETARIESSRLLGRWLAAEPGLPWIILGDLNATPESEPLRALTSEGWRQTLPADAGGTEHAFSGAEDGDRIDHILIGKGLTCRGARIACERFEGRLPSDHWPVVADLVLT
ncbi:endonuclease/exonuclease/phosphatase family protein [Kribbella deserti]|uniref:Endonuclease/exonuclease/phosphatase family protein n=1 Tax=Kribbella deserti TaxID=1926257 RepID=A0ABV6QPD3_9ACTN